MDLYWVKLLVHVSTIEHLHESAARVRIACMRFGAMDVHDK